MSSDPKHTNVGCGLFRWPPYLALFRDHPLALHLWLNLYMGTKAKTLLPGLWLGGVLAMADEASLTIGETEAALRTLTEHDLIEHDPRTAVTRLTKLPDKCERASNANMIYGWWDRREQLVPPCGVRDRHLELMAWLHLPFKPEKRRGSRAKDPQKAGASVADAWPETFGPALEALRAGSVSTSGHTSFPRSDSPLQLDLYAAPDNRNGSPDGSPNRPVPDKDQVGAEERGEVQERRLAPIVPIARAGLELSARELEDLGLEVLGKLGGPDAAKLWRASFEHVGQHQIRLHADTIVTKLYAGEIERELRARTGLPIQLAI